MNLITEHNKKYEFFSVITGIAMKVHRKYHYGLLESAYEAALKYLLELQGYNVSRQVYLPIYWDDVQLDQTSHGHAYQWKYHNRVEVDSAYRHSSSPTALELYESYPPALWDDN